MSDVNQKNVFSKGDKVLHDLSEDEDMVGTVKKVLPNNRYVVEFFIAGRRKGGYMTEIEFSGDEIKPCYIDIERTKRQSIGG